MRTYFLAARGFGNLSGVAAGMILGAILTGCTSGSKTPLVVYSPHGKEMLSTFETAYEKAHPLIDVQWLDMGSQDVYDRIRTERGNPQADVWWGAPSLMFMRAEKESLLERYRPTWAEAVPGDFRSEADFWFGTFVTPEVIMYNSRVLKQDEVPRDWDDLLDPKWRDKVIIRYPLASGTMRIIYCALIQKEWKAKGDIEAGFRWLGALDANTKGYTVDPTQLYLRIAREEGVLTLWNLPDVIIQRDLHGYPFGFQIPLSGTPLIIDGIAIVRRTRHLEEARRFYEFVTSRESLLRQAVEFHRIPARNDIARTELPDWLANLEIKPLPVDWASLASHELEWMKRWDQTIKGRGRDWIERGEVAGQ
jgi:iron(III) transport system substrate-binding protein